MLVNMHSKQHRKIVESNIISNYNQIKQKPGLINLSPYLVKLVLNSYNNPLSNNFLNQLIINHSYQ